MFRASSARFVRSVRSLFAHTHSGWYNHEHSDYSTKKGDHRLGNRKTTLDEYTTPTCLTPNLICEEFLCISTHGCICTGVTSYHITNCITIATSTRATALCQYR